MKAFLAIILVFSLSSSLKAQPPIDSLVLTKEQNDSWISRLEKAVKSRQLELIKARILRDTNVYIQQYYADRIKFDNEKEKGLRIVGVGKPLLIINGQYSAYINNRTKGKSII
jgi:hypothetical protein